MWVRGRERSAGEGIREGRGGGTDKGAKTKFEFSCRRKDTVFCRVKRIWQPGPEDGAAWRNDSGPSCLHVSVICVLTKSGHADSVEVDCMGKHVPA